MTLWNTSNRAVLRLVIEPKRASDCPSLEQALNRIALIDPTIQVETMPGGRKTRISGMDELHLESVCERIEGEHGIEIEAGTPGVIYLETIRMAAEGEGKYIRQTGGTGNYGHCKIRLSPSEPASGYQFVSEFTEGSIPERFIEPIDKGIREALDHGVLAGYPVIDLMATLYDGSYHDADSNEIAFMIAASMAVKEAARRANPVVLEPVMLVESMAPEELTGSIVADVNRRRGRIQSIEQRAGLQEVCAIVPLSELLLASTYGRPDYAMSFDGYQPAQRWDSFEDPEAGTLAVRPGRPQPGNNSGAAELRTHFE